MKKNIHLSPEQQALVESHLSIVQWVIRDSIYVNEAVYGFEYDDLYQEGCILLCLAAASYNPCLAQFPTYAKKVVRNGLVSYCRQTHGRQKHFTSLEFNEHGEPAMNRQTLNHPDDSALLTDTMETLELLHSASKDYQGVTKLGIEALKMKVQGYGISEIAALYRAPPSHVGAWISRASQKLRKNPAFLSGII